MACALQVMLPTKKSKMRKMVLKGGYRCMTELPQNAVTVAMMVYMARALLEGGSSHQQKTR